MTVLVILTLRSSTYKFLPIKIFFIDIYARFCCFFVTTISEVVSFFNPLLRETFPREMEIDGLRKPHYHIDSRNINRLPMTQGRNLLSANFILFLLLYIKKWNINYLIKLQFTHIEWNILFETIILFSA